MLKIKHLYLAFFLIIVVSCFLIGGFSQFFLGIPNTVFSYGIVALLFIFYGIYVLIKKKVFYDRTILILILLGVTIVFSAIINFSSPAKILVYLIFVLLPLGSYLFFKVNSKERFLSQVFISKIFLFIACLQLPIILIQKVGYDFFIDFNMSNQEVADVDFMFGTFFLKADHALGFFLLFNIINILRYNRDKIITRFPKILFLYLSLTILIAESNVTKLILLLLVFYTIYKSFPKKIRVIGFLFILFALPIGFYVAIKNIPAFEREVYFIQEEYNVRKSYSNFKRGIAKRPQVVIVYARVEPVKLFGNGPYSYFNVLTGEFTKTRHFSQLIWAYADLGLIGLLLVSVLLFNLVSNLGFVSTERYILFAIVMVYAFMTTMLADLAIVITLVCLLKKENLNEFSDNSLSRLEKNIT